VTGGAGGVSLSCPNNLNLVKYSGRRIVAIRAGVRIGSQLARSYFRISRRIPAVDDGGGGDTFFRTRVS